MAALSSFKGLILLALLAQNCAVVMLTRHVRVRDRPSGVPLFSVASVVLATEVVKIVVCFWWAFWALLCAAPPLFGASQGFGGFVSASSSSSQSSKQHLATLARLITRPSVFASHFGRTAALIFLRKDAIYMAIPAALFTFQNNILYVAIGNLEVSLFQILYQSKLLLTAVLVAVVFKRRYSAVQWVSLATLFLGVVATQLDASSSSGASKKSGKGADSSSSSSSSSNSMVSAGNMGLGVVAAIAAALSSAVASVVMEKLLKGQQQQQQQKGDDASSATQQMERRDGEAGGGGTAVVVDTSAGAVGSAARVLSPIDAATSSAVGSASVAVPMTPSAFTSPTAPLAPASAIAAASAAAVQAAVSLPARNVQLAFYSILISMVLVAGRGAATASSLPTSASAGAGVGGGKRGHLSGDGSAGAVGDFDADALADFSASFTPRPQKGRDASAAKSHTIPLAQTVGTNNATRTALAPRSKSAAADGADDAEVKPAAVPTPPAAAADADANEAQVSLSTGTVPVSTNSNKDGKAHSFATEGFFAGFDPLVWGVVMLQAIGGIVVALALRYADNVLKGCSVAMAIVVCGVFSIGLFGMEPSVSFVLGAATVTASVFVFTAWS